MAHNWLGHNIGSATSSGNGAEGPTWSNSAGGSDAFQARVLQNAEGLPENPAIGALASQDPNVVAELFQLFQEAGYQQPPPPSVPPQGSVAATQATTFETNERHTEQRAAVRAASEEGEVSEDESMSAYDPEDQTFETALSDGGPDDYEPAVPVSTDDSPQGATDPPLSADPSGHNIQRLDGRPPPEHQQARSAGTFYSHHPATGGHHVVTGNPPNRTSASLNASSGLGHDRSFVRFIEQTVQQLGSSSAHSKGLKPLMEQSEDARRFLAMMTLYGYTLQDMNQETSYFNHGSDSSLLATLYEGMKGLSPSGLASEGLSSRQIGQPLEPTQPARTSVQALGTQEALSARTVPDSVSPAGNKTMGSAETRAAYLAKLKAAKMKVAKPSDSGLKSTSASATPPIQATGSVQPAAALMPAGDKASEGQLLSNAKAVDEAAVQAQVEADARKRRQNQVLQQRLAALKAKQATPTVPKPSTDPSQSTQMMNLQTPQTLVATFTQPAGGPSGLNADATALPMASTSKKRPVAADFEDFSHSPSRPLKQARSLNDSAEAAYEHMVIEVSDDEDSDSATSGIENDVNELIKATSIAMAGNHYSRDPSARKPDPMSNFPSQDFNSAATSLQGTPGSLSTPVQAELSQMELQIAEMKAKIAATEAFKRRKFNSSRPETPQKPLEGLGPSTALSPLGRVAATMQGTSPQTSGMSAGNPVPDQIMQSARLHRGPSIDLVQGSQSPVEQQRKRHADIKSIDARIASNSSRMEQLRQEMALLEAENQREQQEKEALANELEELGVDTVGMEKSEMVAVRDDIRQQQEYDDENLYDTDSEPLSVDRDNAPPQEELASSGASDFSESGSEASSQSKSPGAGVLLPETSSNAARGPSDVQIPHTNLSISHDHVPAPVSTLADTHRAHTNEEPANGPDAEFETDDEDLYASEPVQMQTGDSRQSDDEEDDFDMTEEDGTSESSHSAPVLAPEVVPQMAVSDNSDIVDDHEDEELYSVDPATNVQTTADNPQPGDDEASEYNISSSNGSVYEDAESTSITGTNKHQQKEPGDGSDRAEVKPLQALASPTTKDNLPVVPEQLSTAAQDGLQADDQDQNYEPVDSEAPVSTIPPSEPTVTSFTNQSNATIVPGEGAVSVTGAPPQESLAGDMPSMIDHPMPDLKPPSSDHVPQSVDTDNPHYQPYQSPLKIFKSYRYHPQFSSDVQGGFRSMTYSHQIDPNKPLCPYEAEGGICNDPDCGGQHFRGMELTDDLILVQLGTSNPGRTEEEKTRWNDGLREVLKQLRSTNTRDPNTVAAAIAKYRRDFLADPTKVLNL